MKFIFSKLDKYEKLIFIFAFLVQLTVFFVWLKYEPSRFAEFNEDSVEYFNIAKRLLSGGGLSTYEGLDAFRLPLYPLVLAGLYAVLGNIPAIVILQNLAAIITALIIYRSAKLIFAHIFENARLSAKLSFIVTLLYVFESERLMTTNMLLTENLFLPLWFAGILYFFKWSAEEDKYKNSLLSGIFFGLATLTRATSQALPVIIVLFMLWHFRSRCGSKTDQPRPFNLYLYSILILFSSFMLLLSPWLIRNKYQFGATKLTPLFGYNILTSRVMIWKIDLLKKSGAPKEDWYAFARAQIEFVENELCPPGGKEATKRISFACEKPLLHYSFGQIKENPFSFARLYLYQTAIFFIDSAASRFYKNISKNILPTLPDKLFYPIIFWLGRLVWFFYYFIIALGLIVGWRQALRRAYFLGFLLINIVFIGLMSSFADTTRYRLPINPLIFIFFVYSLTVLWPVIDSLSKRWKKLPV